jgi:hypothetical protein
MAYIQAGWPLPSQRHSYVIMDNQHPVSGELDTQPMSMLAYREAIYDVIPDEVIIPDVLKDANQTIALARAFIQINPLHCRYMIVPHGKSVGEWTWCLRTMIERYGHQFQTVGVPMYLESFGTETRYSLLDLIPERYDVHFLGCWHGWIEFHPCNRIRSWDTSLPISAAQEGNFLESKQGTYKPHLDHTKSVNPTIALENINYIKALLAGKR